jgi:peptidoglycan-N-acetylglucosamine deacetylase
MTTEKIKMRQIENFTWPEGKSCAVAIGWHVDGEAGPIGSDERNKTHLASVSMGAYGVSTAIPRILDLHRQLQIPGSFFIPGYVSDLHPEMVRKIQEEGHEVAHHGYFHKNVFLLSEKEEREEFERGEASLTRLTGKRPVGWSAPGWGVRESTLNILVEMGMIYDSSLMEYDRPYIISLCGKSLVELPISIILDDFEIFGASLFPDGGGVNATAETGYHVWKEEFDGMRHYGGLFSTTFHPSIMGRPGRMKMLDRLFSHMKSYDDIWWATYEDVARYALTLI